jgi:hypothetical protein
VALGGATPITTVDGLPSKSTIVCYFPRYRSCAIRAIMHRRPEAAPVSTSRSIRSRIASRSSGYELEQGTTDDVRGVGASIATAAGLMSRRCARLDGRTSRSGVGSTRGSLLRTAHRRLGADLVGHVDQ